MNKYYILSLICAGLVWAGTAFAQSSLPMVHEGEIFFEKRVNAFAILDQYFVNNPMFERDKFAAAYKEKNPKFGITNFSLLFNDRATLYRPDEKVSNAAQISLFQMLKVVYTDLKNKVLTQKKNIFDTDYLIRDSVPKIQWKITDELRDIAGFSCRRANAVILDSVYVVAFYTDQIVPKGGPESFNGLPGMILGVSLPHEHMTWFARRVEIRPVPADKIQAPAGGEKVNVVQLKQILNDNKSLQADKKTRNLYIKNFLF